MGIPEIIYARALNEGFTKEAACALLANIQGESVFRSDNAEDRIHNAGISDAEYTRRADSGASTYNGNNFVYDAVGYGYAQWTFWSRKQKLLNFAKTRGVSVSDSAMQIDFLFFEMRTDFATQWNRCRSDHDLKGVLRNLIDVWENPADHDGAYNARLPMALSWYSKLSNWQPSAIETDVPSAPVPAHTQEVDEDGVPVSPTWPPRTIDKSLDWKEGKLLQALLSCHGYNVLVDGIFEDALEKKVRKYQESNGLVADGVVGPKTWRKLMELPANF